uniref:Uncharacterized protein n=1 Tax=Anguilla anguilla TaxID=7936 RepID=A0A0E9U7Q5_ANGAN
MPFDLKGKYSSCVFLQVWVICRVPTRPMGDVLGFLTGGGAWCLALSPRLIAVLVAAVETKSPRNALYS